MGVIYGGYKIEAKDMSIRFYDNSLERMRRDLVYLKNTKTLPLSIVTYSFPSMEYIEELLSDIRGRVQLICHSAFIGKAWDLSQAIPDLRIRVAPRTHVKMILHGGNKVVLGSSNFGYSTWKELDIEIESIEAYSYCYNKIFTPMWRDARRLSKDRNKMITLSNVLNRMEMPTIKTGGKTCNQT